MATDCADYGYDEYSDPLSLGCFDSYNASSILYRDTSLDTALNRQWFWMLCNEPFAFWQVYVAPCLSFHFRMLSRLLSG